MKKIVSIILNYNSISDSRKCIEYLKKQSYPVDIILIDNNSKDNKDELRQLCKEENIYFIEHSRNNGYSAGNNIGLKYATYEKYDYALIINPDVEIHDSEYVTKAIDILENDEKIAVLGSDIVHFEGYKQNPMREPSYWEELFWPIELIKSKFGIKDNYVIQNYKSGYCEKVSGCCFFIDVKFAESIGYLDETVFMYCEEPILAATVKKYNKKEYYCSEIVAYHMHKASEKGDSSIRLKQFDKSRKYYLEKYSGYNKIALIILRFSKKIQLQLLLFKNKMKNKSERKL